MADQGLLGGDRPAQMPRGVDGRGAGRQQQGRDAGGWSNSGGHYAQPLLPPVHSAATDSPQYGMQQPPQLGREAVAECHGEALGGRQAGAGDAETTAVSPK
eukprot:gene7819-8016_t